MHTVDCKKLNPGMWVSTRNANRYTLRERAIEMPAYMWNVHRKVDMTPIQLAYREQFERLQCFQFQLLLSAGEDYNDFKVREEAMHTVLANLNISPGDLSSQLRGTIVDLPRTTDMGPQGTTTDVLDEVRLVFETIQQLGAEIRPIVLIDRVEPNPQARMTLGQIFLDTLRYLRGIGEESLANSIWCAIRTDSVIRKSSSSSEGQSLAEKFELPDSVDDLEKTGDILNDPWSLLSLDRNRDGSYYQLWIIERIMKNGLLWVGSYVKSNARDTDAQAARDHFETDHGADDDDNNYLDISARESRLPFYSRALHLQNIRLMSAKLWRSMNTRGIDGRVGRPEETRNNIGAYVGGGIAMGIKSETWTDAAEIIRSRRVAVFDVDGPCEIITPFDRDLEILPRPEQRSMSLCWIVENVEYEDTDNEQPQHEGSELDGPTHEKSKHNNNVETRRISLQEASITTGHSTQHGRGTDDPSEAATIWCGPASSPTTAEVKHYLGITRELSRIAFSRIRNVFLNRLRATLQASQMPEDTVSIRPSENSDATAALQSSSTPEAVESDQMSTNLVRCRSSQASEVTVGHETTKNTASKTAPNAYRSIRGTYRVLRKVRGAWEIMSEPQQMFRFV